MEVLIDNDVIINMARYALWPEFDRLLRGKGASRPYRCLGSARFALGRDTPPSRKFPNEQTKQDAMLIVRLCDELPHPTDLSLVNRLVQSGSIDAGEAILMDYAVANSDSVIVTGDKRCIQGLAADPALNDVSSSLLGRFVPFDRVVHALCEQYGWSPIRVKVCADSGRNPSLAAVLDLGLAESVARSNLQTRVVTFESTIGGLAAPSF